MGKNAPGFSKNNLKHTWFVRAINGRIILYLIWDKFFNFEGSIKSQNVKIQAFWEITRVRNSIFKVRTCKNKHWNFNLFKRICNVPFLIFWCYRLDVRQKKVGPQRSSKISNKAPMSFLLFRTIDHDWWSNEYNKKSSLELYSIITASLASAYIVDVVWCDMWLCCLVFCSKTTNKDPMSLVLFRIIDHDWWSIQ